MSAFMYVDDLRDIAGRHGYEACDRAADEIEDLEKAYALLFAENARLQKLVEAQPAAVAGARCMAQENGERRCATHCGLWECGGPMPSRTNDEKPAPAAPSVGEPEAVSGFDPIVWTPADEKRLDDALAARERRRSASPAAPAGVPTGFKLLKDTTHDERSWPEDVTHENGAYNCVCCVCLRIFIGHKRRVICRVCKEAGSVHPSAAGAGNAGVRNAE